MGTFHTEYVFFTTPCTKFEIKVSEMEFPWQYISFQIRQLIKINCTNPLERVRGGGGLIRGLLWFEKRLNFLINPRKLSIFYQNYLTVVLIFKNSILIPPQPVEIIGHTLKRLLRTGMTLKKVALCTGRIEISSPLFFCFVFVFFSPFFLTFA